MLLPGTIPVMTPQDLLRSAMEYTPDTGEYLKAQVKQGFDRTTTGRAMEEYAIMEAEKEEGTWDEAYAQGQATQPFLGPFAGMTTPPAHTYAMTEDEWKNSEYYIPKARYRPDMTVTRARIMKENYDQRRYLESVAARGDEAATLGMKALGFGATLIGSLPDPVNFIPFASGIKAATVTSGLARGAVEGAVGNAVVDMVVLPDLNSKGEDLGFADGLLDTLFGAVLGGALGGLGGWLGRRRRDALERALREGEGREGLPRHESADILRAGLDPESRRASVRGMEKALADEAAGRPVDVGGILNESDALARAYDAVKSDPLGGPPDEVLASITPEDIDTVLVHRGPAVELDGEIVVQGRKLKAAGQSKRGFGLVKIIFGHGEKGNKTPEMPHVTKEDVVSLPYVLREWEPAVRDGGMSRWNIPRQDGNFLAIVVGKGQDGPNSRLVSMYVDKPDSAIPSIKKSPVESPLPSARQGKGYVPGGIDVLSAPGSLRGKNQHAGIENIVPSRPLVNAAVEAADEFAPAPPLSQETRALADELNVDPVTGLLPEEMDAAGMVERGEAAPEDRDALLAAREEARRVPLYEEIGQSIIPCILEVD